MRKKIINTIYSFYKKNSQNYLGKIMRGVRNSWLPANEKFRGTKGDLTYIESGRGAFNQTKRVAIELSNICNYAKVHQRCPLSKVKDFKILSEKIVYHVLETCEKYRFRGYLTFDVYNEPGIDPRLMMFIKKARKMLPKAIIVLQTNGFYFNQTLADEYQNNGINLIRVSAYTPEEKERFSKIKLKIPLVITPIVLDDRMGQYEAQETKSSKPCGAPLKEVLITCEGRVSLCCFEWKREHIFGDLDTQSLEEILLSQKIRETYKRLSSGDRFLEICKRCNKSR